MRRAPLIALLAAALASPIAIGLPGGPAWAQATNPPAPTPAPAVTAPAADPVVARVDGDEIRLSDVAETAQSLPEQLRGAPQQMIFPLILDQLIAQRALVAAAKRDGLDKDTDVARRMVRAAEQELQQEAVRRAVEPQMTEEALRARYQAAMAGRPAEEEVHARHILVPTEADAKAALAEVRRPGADFTEVAKRRSTGPGAQQGGDLGFFKRGDMIPEFAEAAFALKPGEISPTPVQTSFGWHVIKVEERRSAPPASFEDMRESLRTEVFEAAVAKVVEAAKASVTVERFNMDGSPVTPARAPGLLDGAAPPVAPAPAPARR